MILLEKLKKYFRKLFFTDRVMFHRLSYPPNQDTQEESV